MTRPIATYRLQFRSGMGFEQAAALAPYLPRLGVSHLYASPILEAAPGSTHGYDVTDCTVLDETLGGEAGFSRLVQALDNAGLKLIIDIVPNHMGASLSNSWWRDVLEWGRASAYSDHFDIDWAAPKLLVPALATAYGKALNDGKFSLSFDRGAGSFDFNYEGLSLPLAPRSYAQILGRLDPAIFGALARRFAATDQEETPELKADLAALASDAASNGAIADAVAAISGDPEAMHTLHEQQEWRLAHWRAARERLTYRRFFEIADLVGVRVERQKVFDDTHALVLRLLAEGAIDGLRIDHVDGLADPRRYLEQLRTAAGEAPLYLTVEKILVAGEELRREWPVDGTTGYEFIAALATAFTDRDGLEQLDHHWKAFCGPSNLDEEILRAKREMMLKNLAGELDILKDLALSLANRDPMTRDFGADTMRRALVEFIAALPIYRTYVDVHGPSPEDRVIIDETAERAIAAREIDDPETVAFIARLLKLEFPAPEDQAAALAFTTRFQQTTGAVMAKSVEDTVFYRLNRLIALNEVGGDPDPPELGIAAFHAAMARRRDTQPRGLSATATHDTKRGEDSRTRLYCLSEMADVWGEAVQRWHVMLAERIVTLSDGVAPEPQIEWLFYQAMAGAWPTDLRLSDQAGLDEFRGRMTAFMEKAVREAKLRTTWIAPNEAYEEALRGFVAATLDPAQSGEFLTDFLKVIRPLIVAGALTSLSQTLLKLVGPGIPDIYQGSELFDLSFVDPDNRRPVDFEMRAELMDCLNTTQPGEMLDDWQSGIMKLHVLSTGLRLRQAMPDLLGEGDYLPLTVEGAAADSVIALARHAADDWVIAIAPSRSLSLLGGEDRPRIPPANWQDTAVVLPTLAGERRFRNLLTGEEIASGRSLPLATALQTFPVALLSTITP